MLNAPPGNNVYYQPVGMTVNDWWVVAGDRNIEMRDILGARIVTNRYTIDWLKHIKARAGGLVGFLLVAFVLDLIFRNGPNFGSFWAYPLFSTLITFWGLKKKANVFSLELTTTYGDFEVARAQDEWYLRNITREISKRLGAFAPDSVVSAVSEPRQNTLLFSSEPPEISDDKPITYKIAGVKIEQTQVTLPDRVLPVEDILRAEVRKTVKPMHICSWVGFGAGLASVCAAIFVPILWVSVLAFLFMEMFRLGIVGLFQRGVQEWRRTHSYTVVIETRDAVIGMKPTANFAWPYTMVSNINSVVRSNLLDEPASAAHLNPGTPTKRIATDH